APLVRYSLDEADRYSYDPELARSLLAQAGAKGAVLRLDVGTDSGLDTVAQYVQASLNEVGLDVELRRHEFAVLFQLASSGRTELTIIYSGSDTLDPDF